MCISTQGKVLCIVHKGKFYVSVFLVHKGKFYVCLCMPPHCTHTCTIKEKFISYSVHNYYKREVLCITYQTSIKFYVKPITPMCNTSYT